MGQETISPDSSLLPHLRHGPNGIQLIVKGKPFLMLAGELHNSSLSSARFMADVWPTMKAQSINTLLGSVYWEMIEPVEGQFDFSGLDAVVRGAREHGLHLVLLWFGTYKNGMSTYVPHWVKRDVKRFPRVHVLDETASGRRKRTLEMISPFSDECVTADSRAFRRLTEHLAEMDSEHNTVIMIQVENESGLLGDARDRSRVAEAEFEKGVPSALVDHLVAATKDLHPKFIRRFGERLETVAKARSEGKATSWEALFGPGDAASEAFTANAISTYVGKVAAAGKQGYPIPMYTNTWLNFDDPAAAAAAALDLEGLPFVAGGGAQPGIYPSGGPCPHVTDIWRFNAPALDFLAPDLYLQDYEAVCRDYTAHADSPLFIPEQRRDEHGARRVWLAYATYGALGTGPFGIDTAPEAIGREYKLLAQTKEYLLNTPPSKRFGFFFDELPQSGPPKGQEHWTKMFGGHLEVIVERAFVFGKAGPGGGMVIQLGGEDSARFLAVGRGFNVHFKSHKDDATFTGILDSREKEYVEDTGELRTLRTLNGDETRSGKFLIMPNEDPDYGGFPIAVTIPARTCIAEVEAYWICESNEDM
ncbi:glycoside hydrolase [Microdochium trichocladiopsis]|uniref:Glycoside hydrolase n=1 Tax=Microdochium trichocladiopsis TaxID=1682393 RepID=A0A9P8XUM1_9PEZI|nr:glycoside hydrolase [Microdochium trichocladiopsis]KAH7018398.1 glycoside hydrolase [Microdochium trichocladiopsis]